MYGNDMNGQCDMACATSESPSDAAQRLGYLTQSQTETLAGLATLERKLTAVLMPVPPSPDGGVKGVTGGGPAMSPLCAELERRIDDEHAISRRISDLIDRLTV